MSFVARRLNVAQSVEFARFARLLPRGEEWRKTRQVDRFVVVTNCVSIAQSRECVYNTGCCCGTRCRVRARDDDATTVYALLYCNVTFRVCVRGGDTHTAKTLLLPCYTYQRFYYYIILISYGSLIATIEYLSFNKSIKKIPFNELYYALSVRILY